MANFTETTHDDMHERALVTFVLLVACHICAVTAIKVAAGRVAGHITVAISYPFGIATLWHHKLPERLQTAEALNACLSCQQH